MRIFKWILGILLGLIVVIFAGAYFYLRATLPDYKGKITVPGITKPVEIIRDAYGMPHIYAQTDTDAYFALGYCMAQDRLFHMDLMRRATRGKLAEILGKDLIPVDRFFRTITAGKPIEEIAAAYKPETLSAAKDYAAGVNYFIKHHKGPLPLEFTILGYEPEPWQPSEAVAVHYAMAVDLNTAFSVEMLHAAVIEKVGETMAQEIFPDYAEGYPLIIPKGLAALDFLKTLNLAREIRGTEGGGASNSWVVAGKKSTTGKPILANDPHLNHSAPGIWYEAHIVSPSMNVSGSVLPGIPFVVIGANEHVAWGFTNVMADDADFYIEKINPANPNQYEFMGSWEDMKIKEEVIKVKGADDVKFKVRLTRHGPIIDEINHYKEPKDTALSMRWTAYEVLQETPFYYLNTARSVDDIEKAVAHFKCPGQNWVYADDNGNIGYWAAVGIPIRDGFSGAVPVPGWDGKHEWKGYVPTGQQPHLRNPIRGWIATANNKHVDDDYPYPISHYYTMPDRFVRIKEMITAKQKFDTQDFTKMQADFYVVLAKEWVPMMLASLSLSGTQLSENGKKAKAALKNWNFVAGAEDIAPTIFHATINAMVKNTFKKRLGEDLYGQYLKNKDVVFNAMRNLIAANQSVWFDDPDTAEKESINDIVGKSFTEAVLYLEEKMGSNVDDWKWGDLHTLTLYHPFGKSSALMGYFMNIGPNPMGGSLATVNPQPYKLSDPWEIYHGASLRYIIDFANRKNSRRVIPAGISGNFMSSHYDDQAELWRTGKYRPFVLDRKSVEADARYTLKMLPE
ncbi:MAG: penicillin acylase family protein [Desulfobacterales bacterium]|jgi:penicillin amidase